MAEQHSFGSFFTLWLADSAVHVTGINSSKQFHRLEVFAERNESVQTALEYELSPASPALFDLDTQMMRCAGDKSAFGARGLKVVEPIDLDVSEPCPMLVVDGGWLLRIATWDKTMTWASITSLYLHKVKDLAGGADVLVIFDGWETSTKDHCHRRGKAVSLTPLTIRADNKPLLTN